MVLYEIKNILNGKRYIGQTIQDPRKRWSYHKKRLIARTHTNPHLQRSWNKHNISAFRFTVIETCKTLEELNRREVELIRSNINGYNLRLGGDNGGAHAEETKKRISMAQIGKKCPQRGSGNNIKGHKKSTISINAIISSRVPTGYPNLVSPSGDVVKISNVKEFCRQHGLIQNGVRQVLLGTYSHNKGWRLATKDTIGVPFVPFSINLISPNGTMYTVESLTQFCEQHNLSAGNVSEMSRGTRKQCKGWTVKS